MTDRAWDHEVDVLVVGSGAGGLMAAATAAAGGARVLVIEKSPEFGGTSATSGGGVWIPASHHAAALGQPDSPEEAFDYLRRLSAPNISDELIETYVRWAPVMLRWLEENTPVRYEAMAYPDYHAELPGGKGGYRTHLPLEIDGRALGADVLSLRAASPASSLFGRINWRFSETYALLFRTRGWPLLLARMLARYWLDVGQRLRSRKDRFLTLGCALVGGLKIALNARGVPVWLDTTLAELISEDGAIRGVVVSRGAGSMRIRAAKGVVLAAGGFERNAEMRAQLLPGAHDPQRSGSQVYNTGEAIAAAARAGAAMKNLDSAWWAPVFCLPGEQRGRLSTIERALPGCIMVNQAGRRYMNEAASYHVAGRAMLDADQPGASTSPSWVIFDARFRWRYPMGPVLPMVPDRMLPQSVRSILLKARTLDALERKLQIPQRALVETVERFNAGARNGIDPEFGRGAQAYDQMYGDARVQPNPSLAPIEHAPFYAFPIYPGDIGTNGGLVTDELARVLDARGHPIQGLYAVGNTAASVMGRSYPGAGATLGPALTFAFIAARHLTGGDVRPGAEPAPQAAAASLNA